MGAHRQFYSSEADDTAVGGDNPADTHTDPIRALGHSRLVAVDDARAVSAARGGAVRAAVLARATHRRELHRAIRRRPETGRRWEDETSKGRTWWLETCFLNF